MIYKSTYYFFNKQIFNKLFKTPMVAYFSIKKIATIDLKIKINTKNKSYEKRTTSSCAMQIPYLKFSTTSFLIDAISPILSQIYS